MKQGHVQDKDMYRIGGKDHKASRPLPFTRCVWVREEVPLSWKEDFPEKILKFCNQVYECLCINITNRFAVEGKNCEISSQLQGEFNMHAFKFVEVCLVTKI